MITVNSLSGGKTSSFMAIHFPADHELFACVEQFAPYWTPEERNQWYDIRIEREKSHNWIRRFNSDFVMSAEDDRTLIALHKLSLELGTDYRGRHSGTGKIEVLFARDYGVGKYRTYDDIVEDFLPNSRKRLCTEVLKVAPIYNYVRRNIAPIENVEMRLGFRLDELDRTVNLYFKIVEIKDRKPNPNFSLQSVINDFKIPDYLVKWWDIMDVEGQVRRGERELKTNPFNCYGNDYYRIPSFPLIENGITNSIVGKYWRGRPEYDFPEISNCSICFHHTIKQLQQQWRNPFAAHKMRWAREAEKIKGRTFKRHQVNGKSIPMSMQNILQLPLQLQMDFIDYASCDSGSCTD